MKTPAYGWARRTFLLSSSISALFLTWHEERNITHWNTINSSFQGLSGKWPYRLWDILLYWLNKEEKLSLNLKKEKTNSSNNSKKQCAMQQHFYPLLTHLCASHMVFSSKCVVLNRHWDNNGNVALSEMRIHFYVWSTILTTLINQSLQVIKHIHYTWL